MPGSALSSSDCPTPPTTAGATRGHFLTLCLGGLGLGVFVLLESRSPHPLVPFWVFRDRNRGGAYIIQGILGASLFAMFFLSTLFLQHVLGYSPLKAGLAFVPSTVLMMAGAGVVQRLVARMGVRVLVTAGSALAAVGMWQLSHLTVQSSYLTGVMLPLVILSVGLGVTFVPLTLAAVSGAREENSGLVSGVSTTAIQIGGSMGVALLSTVAATTTTHHAASEGLNVALTSGYSEAFGVGAVILALAAVVAFAFLRLTPTDEAAAGSGALREDAGTSDARPQIEEISAVTSPAA